MDQVCDTASATEKTTRQTTTPVPQRTDEAVGEITATSNLEERFANWGTD